MFLVKQWRKIESLARMSNMSQEDVATGLRTVQQGLEALKEEHQTISNTLETSIKGVRPDEAPLPREKFNQINENLSSIIAGCEETTVII
ncbi:hypothetical protein WR25_13896 [Diploscapter pachys]|uniref:Uncharacterized protein n=1 Tax=Diploscapter pachys TaxID=2018661 RepID=A0A2A2M3V2_9BILA|nr:hypothetical protein WR25_13896 [Diploscapter pachys]